MAVMLQKHRKPLEEASREARLMSLGLRKESVGSSPTLATFIALWCNGSTTDFGSVCLGSNPSGASQLLDGGIGRHVELP